MCCDQRKGVGDSKGLLRGTDRDLGRPCPGAILETPAATTTLRAQFGVLNSTSGHEEAGGIFVDKT